MAFDTSITKNRASSGVLYVPKFWNMLQYALKYESVRTRMPKFLCLFYSIFLSPPNTSLLRQQLQSLSRHAPTSGLYGRALRRPFQAPLQHRPRPLRRRAPLGGSSGLMDLPPPMPPSASSVRWAWSPSSDAAMRFLSLSSASGLMDLPPPTLLGSLIWDGFDGSPTPTHHSHKSWVWRFWVFFF